MEKYTPPQTPIVTSVSLEPEVRTWIDNNIPKSKRSHFFNKLARDYMIRDNEVNRRGKKLNAIQETA